LSLTLNHHLYIYNIPYTTFFISISKLKILLRNSATTMGSLMAGWDSPTLDPQSGTKNKYYI